MKALITGINGFAGQHLAQCLHSHGWEVHGWGRQAEARRSGLSTYDQVDITDQRQCTRAMAPLKPDAVFHLAALTNLKDCEKQPILAHETNVTGTQNVFNAMPKSARGVLASTCHVYGTSNQTPLEEGHPVNPRGVYACSKYQAEEWVRASGRPVVIARAFHHTGPGQSQEYALADWCATIGKGSKRLSVGAIDVERDYSDVRDIVNGYRVLFEHGQHGGTYNLCTGVAWPMRQFIEWALAGREITIEVDPSRLRKQDSKVFVGCPIKAEALGWERIHDLRVTLATMAS